MDTFLIDDIAHLVLIAVMLISCSVSGEQAPEITRPPKSINITVNETAIFICAALHTEHISFYTNLGALSENMDGITASQTIVNDSTNESIRFLKVKAYVKYNRMNVSCAAFLSGVSSDPIEPALLLVQGLLNSVSDLTVTFINSTTVLISWSPPFTLEGVPILGYNVTITNTTSGENETMLVEDTTLLYSIDHPDPENNFTVTVVPINEVGAGQPKVYSGCLWSASFVCGSVLPSVQVQPNRTPSDEIVSTTGKKLAGTILGTLFHTSEPGTGNNWKIMTSVIVISVLLIVFFAVVLPIICICCYGTSTKKNQYRVKDHNEPAVHDVDGDKTETHYMESSGFCGSDSANGVDTMAEEAKESSHVGKGTGSNDDKESHPN